MEQDETTKSLWKHEFIINIDQKEWEKIRTAPFHTVTTTKLRYFQFRHVNRRLKTNVHLSKWKSDRTNKCTFCNNFKETVQHLMWECSPVQKIWVALAKWLT